MESKKRLSRRGGGALSNQSAIPGNSYQFLKSDVHNSNQFSEIMASRQTMKTDSYHSVYGEHTGLRPADIAELGNRYNLQTMSQKEYDGFLEYLEEKGLLSRAEMKTIGYHCEMAGVEGASYSEQPVFHSLNDANGNAIDFISSMASVKVCPLPSGKPNVAFEQIISIYKKISGIIGQIGLKV